MAYTPNTWAAGDTITAQKLNNMEQGISDAGGGALYVKISVDGETVTADTPITDINAALNAGREVIGIYSTDNYGDVAAPMAYVAEDEPGLTFYWVEITADGGGIGGILRVLNIGGYIEDNTDVWYDSLIAPNGFDLSYHEDVDVSE